MERVTKEHIHSIQESLANEMVTLGSAELTAVQVSIGLGGNEGGKEGRRREGGKKEEGKEGGVEGKRERKEEGKEGGREGRYGLGGN